MSGRRKLAEVRAAARALEAEIRRTRQTVGADHAAVCSHSPRCRSLEDMRGELAGLRHDISHWFDPGPGQGTLDLGELGS